MVTTVRYTNRRLLYFTLIYLLILLCDAAAGRVFRFAAMCKANYRGQERSAQLLQFVIQDAYQRLAGE